MAKGGICVIPNVAVLKKDQKDRLQNGMITLKFHLFTNQTQVRQNANLKFNVFIKLYGVVHYSTIHSAYVKLKVSLTANVCACLLST